MIQGEVAASSVPLGHPRVAFTAFRSADDPMLQAWARFRAPLIEELMLTRSRSLSRERASDPARRSGPGRGAATRVAEPDAAGHRSGLWRLLAVNNRELGRSFLLYDSFERARSHVHQLQAQPDALEVTLVPGPRRSSRGWILTFEGAPVMTCGRWYDSISTGIAAADGALAALRTATLLTEPDRSKTSGNIGRRRPAGQDSPAW